MAELGGGGAPALLKGNLAVPDHGCDPGLQQAFLYLRRHRLERGAVWIGANDLLADVGEGAAVAAQLGR
jgi:hypothetical protein